MIVGLAFKFKRDRLSVTLCKKECIQMFLYWIVERNTYAPRVGSMTNNTVSIGYKSRSLTELVLLSSRVLQHPAHIA